MNDTTGAPAPSQAERIANAMTEAYTPHLRDGLPLTDPAQERALVHAALVMIERDLSVAYAALEGDAVEEAAALIEECSRRADRWAGVMAAPDACERPQPAPAVRPT